MTVEEVKKLAKEQYGKDLTDEQAREVLNKAAASGELSDEELEAVGGGAGQSAQQVVCEFCLKGDRLSISMSSGGAYFCERCNRYCGGKIV